MNNIVKTAFRVKRVTPKPLLGCSAQVRSAGVQRRCTAQVHHRKRRALHSNMHMVPRIMHHGAMHV